MSESHAIVIVPTYNERDNLPTLAERVLNQPVAIEMLVVDDGSPDGTGEIADALAKKHSSIHV
ncbi:MAG: glycosyltransferase, partial [Verrucomicrobiales bacterium]